jgi:hypothetical protein
MYSKDFCDSILEKIANMEQMGMPGQQSMAPGSGGLVPGGPEQQQDPMAGGGASAGPKGPPKVKPEQLYERMLKMTGRMADMSAQLGQSGQQTQSMEQMVREDQQEMATQGMGMDPMMGGQPGMDQGMGMGMPQPGMDQGMGMPPQMGLQPQASLKKEIANQLEKEALLQAAFLAPLIADPIAKGWGALKRMGSKFLMNKKISGNPAGASQYNMLKKRWGSKPITTQEGSFRPSQNLSGARLVA